MQVENSLSQDYVGRFAPSPTGPLHFGSLIAAIGSYLEAKRHQGEWLLRIEDLDPPRTVPGASDQILHTLEQHQLHWDRTILYQSQQNKHYQQAIDQLQKEDAIFGCRCSRSQLKAAAIYPGECHNLALSLEHHAIRLRGDDTIIHFEDQWQGPQQWQLRDEIGDFIIQRADRLFSYQLAVVIDDQQQGVTHVIRGSDLLDSTPKQIFLQQQLGYRTPHYGHLPIATTAEGQKLSKQNLAAPLNPENATDNLAAALQFLGHAPPPIDHLEALWEWAYIHWNPQQVPQQKSIPVE